MWEEYGRNAPERKPKREWSRQLAHRGKHRKTIWKKGRHRESVFCTWDADKSRGIEGFIVGCRSGKLCVGRVDGQVGAGTFHIVPTLFHNPAVSTIWWPARGERTECRKRKKVKTLLSQHRHNSLSGVLASLSVIYSRLYPLKMVLQTRMFLLCFCWIRCTTNRQELSEQFFKREKSPL